MLLVLTTLACSVLAGFLALSTLAAILFAERPFIGMAQHWGLQLWWLALLGAALAGALVSWTALVICLACALYWSLRIFAMRRRPTVPAGRKLLRLASANLFHLNGDYPRVLKALETCGADIIVLIEMTPESKTGLTALAATHPFNADTCDLTELYGIQVYSRWPLNVLSRGGGNNAAPRHLALRVSAPGASFDLIATHLCNPTRIRLAPRIPGEVQDLLAQAERGQRDLVLCGDCNAAPWSSWLRRLESATGLRNTGDLNLSWPVKLPLPFRLPIDHVWARGRAVVLETRLGPPTGSDHFPLLAEIGWTEPDR